MGRFVLALPDRALMTIEDSGDPALPPIGELYDRNCDYLFRVVRRLGVDEPHVEDIVHDVFVVAIDRGGTFRGRSSIRTWLYGVAVHLVRQHRRGRNRIAGELVETAVVDPAPGPAHLSEQAEDVRLLEAILDELPDPFREAFVLSEIEELTAPEIAEITEVPLNTVYSRVRLARKRFEASLKRRRSLVRRIAR